MNNRTAILIIAVLPGMMLFSACGEDAEDTVDTSARPAATSAASGETGTTATAPAPAAYAFDTPKKSAHYESNTPAHEAVIAAAPINVVIDVNFDLAPPSEISIMKDSQEYATGETVIDEGKLAMRRNMDPAAPDGLYTVSYNACWPDGSCHDGRFQFAIDSSQLARFTDMTGQSDVAIELKDFSFFPQRVIIDAGATVTWTNNDAGEDHYVNTDSHPAHTYFPPQNSRSLMKNDSYSVTFTMPGYYPYHCSAHASFMKGEIVVR